MPITNHVTSLELSRRLKELKVPQNTYFRWLPATGLGDVPSLMPRDARGKYPTAWDNGISAYLASELGEMLPDIITGEHLYSYQQARNWSDKRLPKHRLVYWFAGEIELYRVDADTECNCRAKMLIHLLENHLISVEELGK